MGVTGRVLEPVPAAYGQRQDTPPMGHQLRAGLYVRVLRAPYLAQRYLGSALKASGHLPVSSFVQTRIFKQEPSTSQSPAD